ncbi:MAG: plasmid pRiA4b ORF-3 family protein [Elusimicrobia bacterium]|nr:plasmid pRiA4b ORF-3 family protein [Elusimicrobiota bacterium]
MVGRNQEIPVVLYQIRVVLQESEPLIWRRILVRSDLTFRSLHGVLQEVMGWTNSHLHQFMFNKKSYGRPDPDGELDTLDDSKVRLEEIIRGKGHCFTYEYDFGDSWDHYLTVEKVLPLEENKPSVLCLAGARACPPEDVGGMGGYENFLEAIKNPDHPEHQELLHWVGEVFDPEAFDLNYINKRLQRFSRRPRPKALA